jgi:hypothetical protein
MLSRNWTLAILTLAALALVYAAVHKAWMLSLLPN